MKPINEPENPEREAQMAFSFEALDTGDQSHRQMLGFIESVPAHHLGANKVVTFPRRTMFSADVSLIARILQRTRHFV